MELKYSRCIGNSRHSSVLIGPCGIEIAYLYVKYIFALCVLIGPCGIEIWYVYHLLFSLIVLIGPCGIEISTLRQYQASPIWY